MLGPAIHASREGIPELGQALGCHIPEGGDIQKVDRCFSFRETLGREIDCAFDSCVHHQNYEPVIQKTELDLVAIERATVKENCVVVFRDEGGDVIGKACHAPDYGLFRLLADSRQSQRVEGELPGVIERNGNRSFQSG